MVEPLKRDILTPDDFSFGEKVTNRGEPGLGNGGSLVMGMVVMTLDVSFIVYDSTFPQQPTFCIVWGKFCTRFVRQGHYGQRQ